MKKYTALFAALTLVLALAGCGAETQTPMPGQSEQEEFTQNSTENVNETDGMTLLDSVFDTLSEGTDVTITLEQEGVRQSYPNTLDTYWAMRMPTSENFNWCGITKEDYSAASSEGEGKQNRLSLSGSKDGEQWSLTVEDDSNYAVLTYGGEAYYFVGAKEYAYDSDWSAAMALRSFYDTMEYKALGGSYDTDPKIVIPDEGQDYLAAAQAGYQQQEEVHLKVSKGSEFCFSFVKCNVMPAEDQTEHFRKEGLIDENTWAIYASTIFVPENERAYQNSMAGNTEEYSGNDADVPAGALGYGRVGYVTRSADGWHVNIAGTGW